IGHGLPCAARDHQRRRQRKHDLAHRATSSSPRVIPPYARDAESTLCSVGIDPADARGVAMFDQLSIDNIDALLERWIAHFIAGQLQMALSADAGDDEAIEIQRFSGSDPIFQKSLQRLATASFFDIA